MHLKNKFIPLLNFYHKVNVVYSFIYLIFVYSAHNSRMLAIITLFVAARNNSSEVFKNLQTSKDSEIFLLYFLGLFFALCIVVGSIGIDWT